MVFGRARVVAGRLLLSTGAVTTGAAIASYGQLKRRQAQLPSESLHLWNAEKDAKQDSAATIETPCRRVLILGGGVVGVTTAYKLGLAGHSVVLLESASKAAAECSACAAGGMQRSNPVVDRDSWLAVFRSLFPILSNAVSAKRSSSGEEESFPFFHQAWSSTLTDPFYLRWIVTFTKTSLFPDVQQQARQHEMLQFTKFAVDDMCRLMDDTNNTRRGEDSMAEITGYNTRGSLSLVYDTNDEIETKNQDLMQSDNSSANIPTHGKNSLEPCRILHQEALFALEPSLKWQARLPTSARFEYEARAASCQQWTQELAKRCTTDPNLQVTFHYETRVQAISVAEDDENKTSRSKPRIVKLHTNRGIVHVPDDVIVIVAAGAWTPHILAMMDLYAPVYPLKGYAMSIQASDALRRNPSLKPYDLPSRIVCDELMFTSRLGKEEIRITSMGELSGWNTAPTPHVDKAFRRHAVRRFPQLQAAMQEATTYCGHRPLVSDGILLLGAVETHQNVYVTCGPGSNGWKLAMGSGEVMARLIRGESTHQIQTELGFDVSAFSPANRIVHAPLFSKLCRARWNVADY